MRNDKPKTRVNWVYVVLCLLGVVVVWIGSTVAVLCYFGRPATAGGFGDAFGAVGSLFTGLALVGIVYALVLQRKDLQATLEEMRQQREAQQLSVEALGQQTQAMEKHARVQTLTTLIQTCLQVDSSTFFEGYLPSIKRTREMFPHYVSRLEALEAELRGPDEDSGSQHS